MIKVSHEQENAHLPIRIKEWKNICEELLDKETFEEVETQVFSMESFKVKNNKVPALLDVLIRYLKHERKYYLEVFNWNIKKVLGVIKNKPIK